MMDQTLLPLLPRMQNVVRQHVQFLRVDLDEGGFDAVHSNARELRKLAKIFEMRPLVDLCGELEHAARARQERDADTLVNKLEHFIRQAPFAATAAA